MILTLCSCFFFILGMQLRSLVGELRSHMPLGMAKTKQKSGCLSKQSKTFFPLRYVYKTSTSYLRVNQEHQGITEKKDKPYSFRVYVVTKSKVALEIPWQSSDYNSGFHCWGCRHFELRSHELCGMAEEKSNKRTPNLKWLVNIYIITLKFFKKLCRQVQEESQSKYRPDFIQLPTNVVLSFLPWLPLCTTSVDASLRICVNSTPQDTNLESSQHQSKKIKLVSSAPLSVRKKHAFSSTEVSCFETERNVLVGLLSTFVAFC